MRALLVSTVLLVLGLRPAAEAQRLTSSVVAVSQADTVKADSATAAARTLGPTTVKQERSWTRYPLIGAAVTGVGLELLYLSQCRHDRDDGCMGGLAPMGFGIVIGAVVGSVVELVVRRTGGS